MKRLGSSIGFAIGKALGNVGKGEFQKSQRAMMRKQNRLDNNLWQRCKGIVKELSDSEIEELADSIQDICTGPRRYKDAKHEVYSRLKHDMISYQYEKVLNKHLTLRK